MINLNEKEEKLDNYSEKLLEPTIECNLESNKTDGSSQIEKLETKGLKLKKITKDRLNSLQNTFGDAETLISTLLNQYESIKIQNDSKFSDRKAEIDKFNYLLESIRNSYLNSLDMATFAQEKYNEKVQNEVKSREKIIQSLQEENMKLKNNLKDTSIELSNKDIELKEVKDNFTRINVLLTTMENDTKEKSQQIQNLQKHITSLTDIVDDNKGIKQKYDEMQSIIDNLQGELMKYKFIEKESLILSNELALAKSEIISLKDDLRQERDYSNSLNDKIHNLIIINSNDNSRLKDQHTSELKSVEIEKNTIISDSSKKIAELKDTIYNLKLELEILKTR